MTKVFEISSKVFLPLHSNGHQDAVWEKFCETFLRNFSPHLPLVTWVAFWRRFRKVFLLSLHHRGNEVRFFKTFRKNEFLAIRTFTYGFVRVFCKTFFKKGVSHYTQKNIALWGGTFRKNSKLFIPPVIRRFEWLIGGVFFKSFSKKFILFVIRRKK